VPRLVWAFRRLVPLSGACAVLAFAAPAAMAATGQINVAISSSPTAGVVFNSTTNTWAPDGTSDPATLNVGDLDSSPGPDDNTVTVSTTSTGTSSSDSGSIDLEADPNDPDLTVNFHTPDEDGAISIATLTVTLDGGTYYGPVQLDQNTTFDDAGGASFRSTVDGAYSLTEVGDGADFWGDVGGTTPLTDLTSDGEVRLFNGPAVTTTGSQAYDGGLSVGGSSVLTSTGSADTANITIGGLREDLNASLLTKADGTTEFDGAVFGDGSFTTEGYSSGSAGTTAIDTTSISTQQASTINFDNAVQLGADLTVSADGGSVTFASTVDSAPSTSHSLTDTDSDAVSLDGAVGATRPLSSVDLNSVTIGGNVTTTGGQTYAKPVLQSSPTLKSTGGGTITFTGKLTGDTQDSLTTHTTGSTVIDQGVAASASGSGITSLDVQEGPSTIAGTVHTSGDQTYGGAITFGSTPVLISDSGNIDSSSAIDLGGGDVQIQGSGSLSGVISDGSMTLGSGSTASGAPSYTLALSDDNTYAGETTVTGTNTLVQFSSRASFGTGPVRLTNGAGLKWAPGTSTDISAALTSINSGGAVFDTNGNDVTLASPITQNVNVGTIVKQGAGQLTLSADNPVELPWDVKAGSLNVTGSLAGPVTVEGGAGFDLSGQVGGHVTVNQSATLTCLGGTLGSGLSNNGTANYAPAAPTEVSAAASAGAATVSFTPGATRCSPLSGYEVTAQPGNIRASGTGSPITISGLRSGTTYTFTVTATNVIGASGPSVSATATTPLLANASIASPGSGQTYSLGQNVPTKFSCTGVVTGALTSCKDSNGVTTGTGRLDTSTPGRHTYVVTATASDGATTVASISYNVSASNEFTLSKVVAHAGGLVTFTVKLPDAGALRVLEKAGKLTLASATRFIKGAATLHLRLTLSRRERKLLAKHSMKATVRITFTPVGGHPRTVQRSGLRLKR
jgi:hypothetical protein